MKQCTQCKETKKETDFYFKNKNKNLRQPICKPCFKAKRKTYYKENKDKIIKKNYSRREFLAQEVDKLKKGIPCKDCGQIYETFCMDFDHLRDKKRCISKMVHDTWSLSSIKEEIKKTELVCVLCHRDRTHQRKEKKSKVKDKVRKKVIERNTNIVNLAKSVPCTICNIQYNPWQMDFDHTNPENKKSAVANLRAFGYSTKVIHNEINKCQVLCALCHRRKTAKTWGK